MIRAVSRVVRSLPRVPAALVAACFAVLAFTPGFVLAQTGPTIIDVGIDWGEWAVAIGTHIGLGLVALMGLYLAMVALRAFMRFLSKSTSRAG